MATLTLLRRLAAHHQFDELRDLCQVFWEETQDPSILPLFAMAHLHLGQKQKGETACHLAKQYLRKFDSDAQTDMAGTLLLLNHHQKAEMLLKYILKKQPNHVLALTRLGLCRMVQNDIKSARMLFQQAASIAPDNLSVQLHLAHAHFKQTDIEPARQVLKKAELILEQQTGSLPERVYQQYRYLLSVMQLKIRVTTKAFSYIEEWLKELSKTISEIDFVHWLVLYSQLLAESDLHQQASDILGEYLKLYPDNIRLYTHLAELEQLQGHIIPAIHILNTALQKDENNISLWVKLSHVCLHFYQKNARMAAEKAVALAKRMPEAPEERQPLYSAIKAQALTALAQVESHDQNFETAEVLYRSVLSAHPDFIPALSGLGHQKIQQGMIDEALDLFQQIKKRNPVKGHASLIIGGHFPEDDETLHKMEEAARQASLNGSLQTGILFQLAAAWDKRKKYDKAIELAKQANQASKKSLSYDNKKHRNYCARIRMAFCKELFDSRPDYGIESTLPVYVVGMPRSGTTLVEQIIAGHSQIFGAGELGTIPQVIQGLNRWERYIGSGRDYPDCIDDLTPEVTKGIAGNVLNELGKLSPDATYIVDKLPHNFENIGLIKFLFPRSKIISVRRDPRDIALSNFFTDYQAKYAGMGFAYDLRDIGEQLADHNLLMHHWRQLFPTEILEIDYEDIVDNLEACARRLLSFIGVAWEAEVLNFNSLKRPVKTASAWQVRQPVYNTSKAKWRNYQKHLKPLVEGTNAQIRPDAYKIMTLPEAGFLTHGVALYRKNDLDAAELSFKKMLHHNPEHAACNYMVGMVYLRKNHLQEGIELIEKALQKAPWQNNWRAILTKAYELAGEEKKLASLKNSVTSLTSEPYRSSVAENA